jgi:L-ascorbate metabolism protein UlaG (beta-lactamase superfamily)
MSSSTILVIYQDELYLERVRAALSPVGYDVRSAPPAAAVPEVERIQPRVVVLCPCVTPDDVEAITTTLKQRCPGLTVLRLSPNHVDRISELLH